MYSRRDLGRAALAAMPLASALAKPDARINGVAVGVQSFSFRDRPLEGAVQAMRDIGVKGCELWQGHIELARPKKMPIKEWRATVSLDVFRAVRKKFDDGGIELLSCNYSFPPDITDEGIARQFEMVKALGVKVMTSTTKVSMAERIYPFAKQANIVVAMHNHAKMDPDEITRPSDFEQMLKNRTPWIAVNLDIGSFHAAGFNPLAFIEEQHANINCLHVKDRSKSGETVAIGSGILPVREILQLIKKNKWNIAANIEFEKRDVDPVPEVRKGFEYCKQVLA